MDASKIPKMTRTTTRPAKLWQAAMHMTLEKDRKLGSDESAFKYQEERRKTYVIPQPMTLPPINFPIGSLLTRYMQGNRATRYLWRRHVPNAWSAGARTDRT